MRVIVTAVVLVFSTFALCTADAATLLPRKPASNVMASDQVSTSFLIPAVGNTAGAFGTFFRSEVVLSNFRNVSQKIAVTVLPEGESGSGTPVYFTLPALNDGGDLGLVSQDFYGTELGRQGLGAILVQAVTENNQPDANGQIDGFSRVYTTVPTNSGCTPASGTMSQPLLAVFPDGIVGGQYPAFTLGMRQDENFRTNVGLINLSNETITILVEVFGRNDEASTSVTLPPRSMRQVPAPGANLGAVSVQFTLKAGSSGAQWAAYASSVDNRTGDGYTRNASY